MIETAMLKVFMAYHMSKWPRDLSNAEGEGHIGLNSENIEAEDDAMSSRYSNWSISLPRLASRIY